MSPGARQAWARSVIGVAAGLLCPVLWGSPFCCMHDVSSGDVWCSPRQLSRAVQWCWLMVLCHTRLWGASESCKSRHVKTNKKRKDCTFQQHFMKSPRVRCSALPCARHVNVGDAVKWQIITLLYCGMCNVEKLLSKLIWA